MSESDRDAVDVNGLNPQSEGADSARPTVPRRAMLKTGAAAGAAAAAFLIAPKLGGVGTASAASPRQVTAHVNVDLSTFVVTPGGAEGTGPFHVRGAIVENADGTGDVLGGFQCWGYIFDTGPGDAVVTQEYDFVGRGKIIVAGVEDSTARPIVGGTTEFGNARGEMIADLSAFPGNPVFTAVFGLRA